MHAGRCFPVLSRPAASRRVALQAPPSAPCGRLAQLHLQSRPCPAAQPKCCAAGLACGRSAKTAGRLGSVLGRRCGPFRVVGLMLPVPVVTEPRGFPNRFPNAATVATSSRGAKSFLSPTKNLEEDIKNYQTINFGSPVLVLCLGLVHSFMKIFDKKQLTGLLYGWKRRRARLDVHTTCG